MIIVDEHKHLIENWKKSHKMHWASWDATRPLVRTSCGKRLPFWAVVGNLGEITCKTCLHAIGQSVEGDAEN
jgi:hypothetical protein